MTDATRDSARFLGFPISASGRNLRNLAPESRPPRRRCPQESRKIPGIREESRGISPPVFKYSLQIGKKGDSIKVKLKKEHYGKKWIIAKKK